MAKPLFPLFKNLINRTTLPEQIMTQNLSLKKKFLEEKIFVELHSLNRKMLRPMAIRKVNGHR